MLRMQTAIAGRSEIAGTIETENHDAAAAETVNRPMVNISREAPTGP